MQLALQNPSTILFAISLVPSMPLRAATTVTTERADVVIAGAGPAGATAALCLARRGASVVIVDPLVDGGLRVGETLPPATRDVLASIGLWDRFAAAGHRRAYAIRSVWGSDEPADQDHLFHPYGNGWHIDRRAFDRMLVDAAVEAGARLVRGTIDLRDDVPRARHIVDATGRTSRIARHLGAKRIALDRLVGVVASMSPEQTTTSCEGATLIEAVADGWWYSARTPDDHVLVAYMTDGDLWTRASQHGHGFVAAIEHAPLTRARVRDIANAAVQVIAAGSAHLSPASGRGWFAAGDAAMAVDPLAGNGVCLAIRSGVNTAAAIVSECEGDETASEKYSARVSQAFTSYAETWRKFYGFEQRFASSEFWRRRAIVMATNEKASCEA
jgi:flavin-dependent dehydrogenase